MKLTAPAVAGAGAVPTWANVPPVAPSARSMLKLLSPARLWNVTMMLDVEMLESGAQAARRSASTRLTQSRIRFQLAKVRRTNLAAALVAR